MTSSQLPATRECDPQPVSELLLEIDHLKMVINAVAKPPCDCFGCQQVAEITCSFHGKHKLVWKYLDFPHQALLKLEKWKVIANVSLESKSCASPVQPPSSKDATFTEPPTDYFQSESSLS